MRKIPGAFVISLALAGCSSHPAVASPSSGTAADTANSSASARRGNPSLKIAALPDPSLGGMVATFVAVPSGWRVSGQMNANPCVSLPDAAWSAASPDGQSSFDVLPKFAWRLGDGVRFGQGCDPLKGTPKAAEFLNLLVSKLPGKVQVVGAMPPSDAFRKREESFTAQGNGNDVRLAPALRRRSFGDVAAVRAIDASGREMRLRAWVQCRQSSRNGDCFAKVDVLASPKGRLDALVSEIDGLNLVQDVPAESWLSAYSNRQQRIAAGQFAALTGQEKAGNAMLRNQFEDSTARLRAEHEAGMKQLQSQGQHAMQNSWNAMNARTTAASDWRDYAADQQTVSGVNGTYKTSSQYTNVWSSPYGPALSDGRTFGTTDNTVDPNTATDNTFTKDHKVHGNGQAF